MAEDSDLEKTESASPKRLEDARQKGQVARSKELSTFVVLAAGGGGLWIMGSTLLGHLSKLVKGGMNIDRELAFDVNQMMERLQSQTFEMLFAFLPFLGLLLVAALGAPLLLNGWLFSVQAIQPDLSRLNPIKGLTRIFSVNALVELAKAVAKVVLIGGVAFWVIWSHKEAVFALIGEPIDSSISHLGNLMGVSFLTIVGSMIVIVAVDVPFQLWDHGHKLKMTKDEVRKEAKETEGDPQMKARIRGQQREMARRRMMSQVPKADVIVTNPSHYAVALCYQSYKMGAPRVVAKGTDLVAACIRQLAEEHHVPILEAPSLARALYHHTELGDEIPEKLYNAVAEVLAYVFQLRRYHGYGGNAPQAPQDLPVPSDLDPQGATI